MGLYIIVFLFFLILIFFILEEEQFEEDDLGCSTDCGQGKRIVLRRTKRGTKKIEEDCFKECPKSNFEKKISDCEDGKRTVTLTCVKRNESGPNECFWRNELYQIGDQVSYTESCESSRGLLARVPCPETSRTIFSRGCLGDAFEISKINLDGCDVPCYGEGILDDKSYKFFLLINSGNFLQNSGKNLKICFRKSFSGNYVVGGYTEVTNFQIFGTFNLTFSGNFINFSPDFFGKNSYELVEDVTSVDLGKI
jgi:hypothetical protein